MLALFRRVPSAIPRFLPLSQPSTSFRGHRTISVLSKTRSPSQSYFVDCFTMPPKRAASTKQTTEVHSEPSDSEDVSQGGRSIKANAKAASKKPVANKRKLEDDDDDVESKPAAKAKKTKTESPAQASSSEVERASNGQPTNKVIPVHVQFPPKSPDSIRIATWNICGLAASSKKGFKYYVEAEDADVLILTETKVNDNPVDPILTKRYPHRYWSISAKKTYSGTAILSKIKPLSVDYTLPGHPDPSHVKGRIVTLEFENMYVVGTYVVNAGTGLKTMPEKKTWNEHFDAYIHALDAKKPVIWTGDLNVAPTELDLANPKTNWNKTPGYTEEETSAYKRVLDPKDSTRKKMVDVWRHLHPDLRHYTYFSYRFNCRSKGIGWRLDHFVVSERLLEKVKMCEIRDEIYGASDHCPVVLEIEKHGDGL